MAIFQCSKLLHHYYALRLTVRIAASPLVVLYRFPYLHPLGPVRLRWSGIIHA